MKLQVESARPAKLRDGSRDNLIYTLTLAQVPTTAGVYVFGRRWGKQFEALYVGKAIGACRRIAASSDGRDFSIQKG